MGTWTHRGRFVRGEAGIACYTVYTDSGYFEWAESKNRTNIAKNRISFETAKLVFDDPHVVSFPERHVEDEERWQSLGSADRIVILTVAHTVQDSEGNEVIWIISARKASPSEGRRYAR